MELHHLILVNPGRNAGSQLGTILATSDRDAGSMIGALILATPGRDAGSQLGTILATLGRDAGSVSGASSSWKLLAAMQAQHWNRQHELLDQLVNSLTKWFVSI